MVFAGDELAALLSGASKTARGSAAKGTGVRQKRILNATAASGASGGLVSVVVDGAATASPAAVPTGYGLNTGDRVLVTKIGTGLQVVTGQSGQGTSNGVASVTAGLGLTQTGPASNPVFSVAVGHGVELSNNLVSSRTMLGAVNTVSGSVPATMDGEDGGTYSLFTGAFPVGGSATTGVPSGSGTYAVGDPLIIRTLDAANAVVVARLV